jgi:hypothetical protein
MDNRQQTDTGDTLTIPEMTSLMRDDLARLIGAEAAFADHEAAWTALETTDRIRADDSLEHRTAAEAVRVALLAQARPDYEAAARAAEGAASAAERNARRILAQVGEDRTTLPLTEITAASAMAPLIERDAERLSLPRIATEIRTAVATGDDASMYVWSRAIAPRLATRPPGEEHPDDARARSELARLQSQIREKLRDRTFDPIRQQADRVLERTWSIRAKAGKTRQRLAGPVKTTAGETKVPWPQDVAR